MPVVGLIADTHFSPQQPLNPAIEEFFTDVDAIIHAGDIGDPAEFDKLQAIAPVTAVMGNKRYDHRWYTLPRQQDMRVGPWSIHVRHGVAENFIAYVLEYLLGKHLKLLPLCAYLIIRRIQRDLPAGTDFVIYGHSHFVHVQRRGKIMCINPGAAFHKGRRVASVAKLVLPDKRTKRVSPQLIFRYFL